MRAHHLRLALGLTALVLAVPTVASASHAGPVYLGDENLSTSITSIRAVTNGPAFYATNEWANGIAAISYATVGIGVYGIHQATGGSAPGLRGDTNSTAVFGVGVEGVVTSMAPGASSAAVRGRNNGTGSNGVGVWGSHNGSGVGVSGEAPSGYGVEGVSDSDTGVHGESGTCASCFGVEGIGNVGVRGQTTSGGDAVRGVTFSGGNAGRFLGPVAIEGPLRLADISTPVLGPVNGTSRDVSAASFFTVNDTATTTVTTLTGGLEGQRLTLRFTDSLTTLADNNGSLNLAGNFVGTASDTIELIHSGGNWYELGRSVN
jgi:hypothetical protein